MKPTTQSLAHRHLAIGWLGLLVFLLLGIALETLHGVKSDFYLDTRNTTRRMMWTLAHVHGALFSILHILFALCLLQYRQPTMNAWKRSGQCLTGALVLMPLGFFLGGLWLYGGDPGAGIFLVPIGAICLLIGVALLVLQYRNHQEVKK